MTDHRDAAIRETKQILEAAKTLHASLRANESVYRRGLKALEQGKDVATILGAVDVKSARQQLNETLEAFEHCRHQVRLALTAAGMDEGMTISDTGRAWGVSRQLASRYAHEALDQA